MDAFDIRCIGEFLLCSFHTWLSQTCRNCMSLHHNQSVLSDIGLDKQHCSGTNTVRRNRFLNFGVTVTSLHVSANVCKSAYSSATWRDCLVHSRCEMFCWSCQERAIVYFV
uniref:Uncharacterized protein n=1 Tax=Rhipicephalus zambeziensis TaxID=60191 RepID=A0A224Y9S4_9ACAR